MLTPVLFFIFALVTIVTLVWTGMQVLRPQDNPLSDRLSDLRNNTAGITADERERRGSKGFLNRFVAAVAGIPGGDDWLKEGEKRLRQAGYRGERALGIYAVSAASFFAASIGVMIVLQRGNPVSNMFGGLIAAGVIGFVIPGFTLGKLSGRYRKRLQEALPDTVDLLGIVLGTGLALDQALLRVSEEMRYIYPELANEFYTVVMQVRAGQERSKAFSTMVRRTGIDDIKALSAMIIQSEKFGTSLSQALKVYADALRNRRKLRAEESVAKAGIKMLFPIVIFILPVLFVITLVPGMLSVMHDLQSLGR